MKKLIFISLSLLFTLPAFAWSHSSCYGIIDRKIGNDVQVVLDLENCNLEDNNVCVTGMMYDNYNRCDNDECTESQPSYLKIKLVKKNLKLKIKKIFGNYDDEDLTREGYEMTKAEKFFIKSRLSFFYKNNALMMRNHLRKVKMDCYQD